MNLLRYLVLAVAFYSSELPLNASSQTVVEMSFVEEDEISPSKVEHRCEEIFEGEQLVQIYNYIYYEFQTEEHFYWARSYLDEIEEVSIYGPFPDASRTERLDTPIDERILAYLQRRYSLLQQLGESGYEPVP